MTPTEQAARWLADVRRFIPTHDGLDDPDEVQFNGPGGWIRTSDALPAVSSHPLASDARRALEADDVHGWIKSLPAAPGEDVREGALKEALEAMRGAGSAGRTKAERKAALEQYCLDRDAILALIPGAKP